MTPREQAQLAQQIAEVVKPELNGRRRYMSIAEVAEYLRVSERQVVTQKVPFKMVGNRKIYNAREVDQWVDRDDDRVEFLANVAWALRMGGHEKLSDRLCGDLGFEYDELQEAGWKIYNRKAKNGISG